MLRKQDEGKYGKRVRKSKMICRKMGRELRRNEGFQGERRERRESRMKAKRSSGKGKWEDVETEKICRPCRVEYLAIYGITSPSGKIRPIIDVRAYGRTDPLIEKRVRI